jgi:hypothetical protein
VPRIDVFSNITCHDVALSCRDCRLRRVREETELLRRNANDTMRFLSVAVR